MLIRLFSFSKRSNSTARPATTGSEQEVKLKDGTSILRPSFLLQADPVAADWYEYNYVYAPAWGRYYHVLNIESVRNDLWRIDCDVDVLASFKTEIQQTTAFVAYDATTVNSEIPDTRLSVNTSKRIYSTLGTFSTIGTLSLTGDQAIVLTAVGRDEIGHYVLNGVQVGNLLQTINQWMDTGGYLPVPDVTQLTDIVKCLQVLAHNFTTGFRQLIATGNASDNIKRCVMLPFLPTSITGTPANVLLGDYDTGIVGKLIPSGYANRYIVDSATVPINWPTADWRRQSPYTTFSLYIPYVGYINISPSAIMGDSALRVTMYVDCFTGDTLVVLAGAGNMDVGVHEIGRYTCNIAVPLEIGASIVTPMQTLTNMVGAAVSAASLGGGNLNAAGGVIQGVIGAIEQQPSCISSGGGGAEILGSSAVHLYAEYHDTTVVPFNLNGAIGTPTMSVMSLANLSGYVETREASVTGDMTETERERINQMLDGGIYIE